MVAHFITLHILLPCNIYQTTSQCRINLFCVIPIFSIFFTQILRLAYTMTIIVRLFVEHYIYWYMVLVTRQQVNFTSRKFLREYVYLLCRHNIYIYIYISSFQECPEMFWVENIWTIFIVRLSVEHYIYCCMILDIRRVILSNNNFMKPTI